MLTGLLIGFGSGIAVKKSRKMKAKLWMWKMKRAVYQKLRKLKNPKQKDFESIVDSVIEKAAAAKNIGKDELENFAEDLKDRWQSFKSRLQYEMGDDNDDEDEDDE